MFNINDQNGIVLFVIFIMISVLFGNFSRKNRQKNKLSHLPGWYLVLRPIAQVFLFLFIISFFFTQKTDLLWVGIIGLVLLDVFHAILSFIMTTIHKSQGSGAAINEQPSAPQQKPFDPNNPETASAIRDIGEILAYPKFSEPGKPSKNILQPTSNIDHFDSGSRAIKGIAIFLIACIFIAAAAIWILNSSGGLDQFFR